MRYIPQIIMWWILSIQLVFANVDTYRTKKGETLLKIAAKLQEQREDEDFSDQQLAFALYKHNPLAFQTCNLFALKIGFVLKIPQDQFIATFNPQYAALEIKRQQQQWKTAKGKIKKIICPLLPDPETLEMPSLSVSQTSVDLLPILEDVELKDNLPSPPSPPLSAILTVPFKPLTPDFYSIDLIDNLQDLPSLELIPFTPFEELPLSTRRWEWWQLLITLSGFLWGFWLLFVNRPQPFENKEELNIATPQVLEIATLDTDNSILEFESPHAAVEKSEENTELFSQSNPQLSFEHLLEDAFQNWNIPINATTPLNTEEILSNEELAQSTTNEPVIDRQMLEKVFQLN